MIIIINWKFLGKVTTSRFNVIENVWSNNKKSPGVIYLKYKTEANKLICQQLL